MPEATASRNIRVLLSVPPPRPTTNPYVVMLADALRATDGLQVEHFSWRTLLVGRYDVFHIHWPETLVRGSDAPRTVLRHLLLGLAVARMSLSRIPVVRTLHNESPHEPPALPTRLLLAQLDRRTRATISLNPHTRGLPGVPNVVIPHGHYLPWFAKYGRSESQRGLLVSFGAIRRYKNLGRLVTVFSAIDDADLRLTIAGSASDASLADELRTAAAHDPRVDVRVGFVADAQLVDLVTSSELVVLPYAQMHNSGALLAALSMDRPVLVPDSEVNRALAEEFGDQWVRRYEGELHPEALLEAVRSPAPVEAHPPLDSRNWDLVGGQHAMAYRTALGQSSPASTSAGGSHG